MQLCIQWTVAEILYCKHVKTPGWSCMSEMQELTYDSLRMNTKSNGSPALYYILQLDCIPLCLRELCAQTHIYTYIHHHPVFIHSKINRTALKLLQYLGEKYAATNLK